MYNDPGRRSSLNLYDTDGKPRVQLGLDNDPDTGSFLTFFDTYGKPRAVLNVHPGGQAGLSISAGKTDRAIKIAAMDEGELYLMLSQERIPMAGLRLAEGENRGLSSDLALVDKDGRAGVAISGGSRFGPAPP